MKRIFLDIETLPPSEDHPLLRHKNHFTDEQRRNLALQPEYGRLLCIALIFEVDGEIKYRGLYGRDKDTLKFHLDEKRILQAFWKLLKDFNVSRDLLIGHNILDFDLRFIYEHSVIQRVKPSVSVSFKRYCSRPVYDTMWQFSHWRHRISLDNLATVLGLESSKQDGIDGSKVYELFLEDRHREIADYCLRDVDLTREIYQRLEYFS